MATIHLYDHSLSGAIEFVTDDSPEEVHAYLESIVGSWCDLPGTNGAILLGGEWWADYFLSDPNEPDHYGRVDAYPDFRLTGSERPEFAEFGAVTPA